ncbi:hypothetical protein [Haladaptatus cibarius]|uniref:hypothetical protein n=1 Tax=Haladaptatus cibarius TaxID=453847 RepID=UPI00067986F7|nr:hypothetical protein [Haladaptatus cibarius]
MSLLEVNIEKPALVEERVYPDEDTAPASARTKSESSGRSVGSLVKPLLGLLVVAGIALVARKLRAASAEDDATTFEADDFDADDFDAETGRGKSAAGVAGVLVSLLGVVALARKVRGGSADE